MTLQEYKNLLKNDKDRVLIMISKNSESSAEFKEEEIYKKQPNCIFKMFKIVAMLNEIVKNRK